MTTNHMLYKVHEATLNTKFLFTCFKSANSKFCKFAILINKANLVYKGMVTKIYKQDYNIYYI